MKRLVGGAMACLIGLGCAGIDAVSAQPPPPGYAPIPPPRAEVVPPPPGPRVIWQPGHWHWNGFRYVWFGGHYVERGPHFGHYADGRWLWAAREGRWVWRPAHWE